MFSRKETPYKHIEDEQLLQTVILLQRIVRGHLTRSKLHEAKELYNSIFAEIENDSDSFQPSGMPAKKVDGTMFRKLACYKVQQGDSVDCAQQGGGGSDWLSSNIGRPTCRTSNAKRSEDHIPNEDRNEPVNWPRGGIQPTSTSLPHSPCSSRSNSRPSSPRSRPSTRLSNSPRNISSPMSSPKSIRRSTEIVSSKSRESCAQTDSLNIYSSQQVGVNVSVQTVCEIAIQTDSSDYQHHSRPNMMSGELTARDLSRNAAGPAALVREGNADERIALLNVYDAEKKIQSDAQEKPLQSAQRDSPTPAEVDEVSGQVDLTHVTPLSSPGRGDVSRTFLLDNIKSSTPLRSAGVQSSNHSDPKVSGAGVLTKSMNQTSVWEASTKSPPQTSNDIKTDLTHGDLQTLRENMSMELMWIDQAIASRKQYLSLVNSMAGKESRKP